MTTSFNQKRLNALLPVDPELAKVRSEMRNTLEKELQIERQHSDWQNISGAFETEISRGVFVKSLSKKREGD